jgi:2-keto-4-pentenoate hydratase/2-oxohepta-3-ene-1,7-dioic acid hydratase in catechol pathway
VLGPGQAILQDPSISTAADYEAELAVVIGRGGRNIPAATALDYAGGYTIVNDATARDLQKAHQQWLLDKSQDTFCPMGPCLATREEIDLTATCIRCSINDTLRQDADTDMMIFDGPTLIATISRGITLAPGDIIATGTPSGVGIGFSPPRWLVPDDEVRIETTGIGTLVNPVASSSARR